MITILMATYNGATYLPAQIDSLLGQTVSFDKLYIQDDCSTDDTWAILEHYQSQYPDRIAITRNEKNTGNPKHNFYSLMSRVQSDYTMLCDQDDVWLPEKIEKTLAKMREMEGMYGKDTPLLVHTDLAVTDEELQIRDISLFHMQGMNQSRTALPQLLVQNIVTGCAVMYNRALLRVFQGKTPSFFVMHDWWIALLACCFGQIGFLEESTMLYRQHTGNTVGAKKASAVAYKLQLLKNIETVRKNVADTYLQAESLLEIYQEILTPAHRKLLKSYVEIPKKNKISRYITMWKLGTLKYGILRKIAAILYI